LRHLWFRTLDASALRRACAALREEPTHLIASRISPEAEAQLARTPLPSGALTVLPVRMAVENEAGCNLRARGEVIGATLVRLAAGEDEGYRWLTADMRRFGPEWLRILGGYYYAVGEPLLFFLTFVENAYRAGALAAPDELMIDLGGHPVAKAFAEHAATVLRLPFKVTVHGRSPSPLVAAARTIARQVLQLLYYLAMRMKSRAPVAEKAIGAGGRGIMLVGYERGMLDRLPLGVAIDWFEASGLASERVVFCFDRADTPRNEETCRRLRERGFGWVDFGVIPKIDPAAAFTLFRAIVRALRMMPPPWRRIALRRWILIAQLLPKLGWYRAFLKANKVYAFHQGGQFSHDQLVFNLACRQEDVAVIWSYWSVLLLLEHAANHAFVDLLLAFGDYDLGYCNTASFDYRYAAETGMITYDGAQLDDVQKASELRSHLKSNPRFVLAAFDSSYHPTDIHQSTERCLLFYRTVLGVILDHPDWGCLIKSKATAYDDLPVCPGVQEVIAQLETEGRCTRLPNEVKPSLVASAADAIAGFGVNSAALTAALVSGRPVLNFDPNHLAMHPLVVAGGDDVVIFRDAARFTGAMQSVAAGETQYGDFKRWARLIDPFLDGVGRKRSGAIIGGYFAARDAGAAIDTALRAAVAQYAAIHGCQLATTRYARHDSPGDRLWRQVRGQHYQDWPEPFPPTAAAQAAVLPDKLP
jgi:hypothetical protein